MNFMAKSPPCWIAEAEFDSDYLMRDFEMPDFALCEVTDDMRFTGPYLARYRRPD
jgi:CYTH domain-containing protein